MKRLLLGCALLALCASSAFAGGVNISWGNGCWSDPGHTNLKLYACNKNTGSALMTCSFSLDYDQPQWAGVEIYLDGQTDMATIPDWWKMDTGECRVSALTVSNNFTAAPGIGCANPWGSNWGYGGLYYYYDGVNAGGPNRAKMALVFVVQRDEPVYLSAGTEYYAGQIKITYAKTVGTGSCVGCLFPMAWFLTEIRSWEFYQCQYLTEPLPAGNQCLNWQGSNLPWCPGDGVVPTRNHTWGGIKSLYR
jgi:hypothetical protein